MSIFASMLPTSVPTLSATSLPMMLAASTVAVVPDVPFGPRIEAANEFFSCVSLHAAFWVSTSASENTKPLPAAAPRSMMVGVFDVALACVVASWILPVAGSATT